jgi:ribosomal protein S12
MFAERQAQILLAKPNLSLEKSLNVKVYNGFCVMTFVQS